ncbi:MAG TPA: HAMP domain-containing sensor histidine kinase [Acidimicrobiales bacterium]|nr:HAMP domain-containing sensor histidine kinase [Acidimicrobiales bacterium]
MTRRVGVLIAVHVLVALAILPGPAGSAVSSSHLLGAAALAAAYAAVGLVPVNIEHGRHAASFSLVDAVVVVGLFLLPPLALAGAAAAGEAVACAAQRQRLLKLAFNVSAVVAATSIACLAFSTLHEPDAASPRTWIVVLVALAGYALANHVSTSAVLSLAEARTFSSLFFESAAAAVAAASVCGAIGLSVVVLHSSSPLAPLLLLPLGAVAYAAFRAVAFQRSETLRFQRLYDASSRTGSLRAVTPTLASLADAARSLVGGEVAIAAAPAADGRWCGVLVGERFGGPLGSATVEAVRGLRGSTVSERPTTALDPLLSRLAPSSRHVVIASAAGEAEAVLVVFRDVRTGGGTYRGDVLGAFAAHAALAAANGRLFEEIEESLQRQIDLHREKDEFLAAVSHELRTPLTGVLGALATLRRLGSGGNDDRTERLLEICERQGGRLKGLIEDLLLMAAVESGSAPVRPEPVELGPFLDRVTRAPTLDPALVQVSVSFDPGTPRVLRTDPSRAARILEALLDNAQKFAPGPVEVVASPAVGGGLSVAVRDHGPGIPVAQRTRIFDQFVQLDQSSTRTHGGTGTGLYLSRRLADLLGGVVVLHETPGGGSTFVLALPDQPDRAIANPPVWPDHGKLRVVAMAAPPSAEDQP